MNSSLQNLYFFGCTGVSGGAILISGPFIIDNITAVNCSVSGRNKGGAIFANNNAGIIKNSQFYANTAYYGGAIHWTRSNAQIVNCTFHQNTANYDSWGYGGNY